MTRDRVDLDARGLGLLGHGRAAGELGDEHVVVVADERRVDVLEGARLGAHAGGVQAGLVRERVLADVRLVGVGRAVEQLVGEVRGLGQLGELLGRQDLAAELELQAGDDRDEVRVAGALADAVHRALHLRRAGLDGDERVGHGALGVVVASGCRARPPAARRATSATTRATVARQRAAVGVAQHDALGARLDRGARAERARSPGRRA